jgi:hypothetical protein
MTVPGYAVTASVSITRARRGQRLSHVEAVTRRNRKEEAFERCSTCGGTLVWANGRLICPRVGCPGHIPLAASSNAPSAPPVAQEAGGGHSAHPTKGPNHERH